MSVEHEFAFEAFGLRVLVVADSAAAVEDLELLLPPGSVPSSAGSGGRTFALRDRPDGMYDLTRDGDILVEGRSLTVVRAALERELLAVVALEAPGRIFVHAGVVAHDGAAIVIPGKTYSGKTSLVAALVRAGAVYYSDEYALLDASGLVHPFAKPLSLRESGQQFDHPVEMIGGVAGDGAVPIGLVVVTTYAAGASWQPTRLSAGEAALELLTNTLAARTRPGEVMRSLTRAVAPAVTLKGERSEAGELAPLLLAELRRARS